MEGQVVVGLVLRSFRTALALVGAATLIVSATPLTSWLAHLMAGHFNEPAGDVLVLLTAAPAIDGVLSEGDHIRSLYAVRAWRAGHFRQVLISGGTAASIRDFLATQGVPSDMMRLEDRSLSTRDSAVHVAPLVRGSGRVVLMTSDYHAFRASRTFARAGVTVLPRPVPDAFKRAEVWYLRWGVFTEEVSEACKIVGYRIRGWI
jgi:uncharacterized SAM-binding protein YcdF (DUF218 family)